MNRAVDLSRDVVGLLQDHVGEISSVAVAASKHAGRWDVVAATVAGESLVLARGLTRDTANDLADEARLAVLTLRTGRSYPESGDGLPEMVRPQGPPRFGTMAAGGGGGLESAMTAARDRMGIAAGGPLAAVEAFERARPAMTRFFAWKPVPDFRGIPLMTVARERAIDRRAWLAIGATYADNPRRVHWRTQGHGKQACHYTLDGLVTLCNLRIPAGRVGVSFDTVDGSGHDCTRCNTSCAEIVDARKAATAGVK